MKQRLDPLGFPYVARIADASGNVTDETCHSAREKELRERANRKEVVAWLGLEPEERVGDYGRFGELTKRLHARVLGLPEPEFRVWDMTGWHS